MRPEKTFDVFWRRAELTIVAVHLYFMKLSFLTFAVSTAIIFDASAGVFTIGGFKFDEKNTVSKATLVEGDGLKTHANTRFGRFSESYVKDTTSRENEFAKFDRKKSVGSLLDQKNKKKGKAESVDYARQISFAESKKPGSTTNRYVIELSWQEGMGLKNGTGADFVVFETSSWEGFSVAVQKAGGKEFTAYRYQFPKTKDPIQDANAVAFDLSDFGLSDAEMITAIRIQNLFNSKAPAGADRVDNASGEGMIVLPQDAGYDKASLLRQKAGGEEFPVSMLGADIVYVAALHDIEEVKIPEPVESAPAAPAPAPVKAQTNVPVEKPAAPKK